MNKICIYLSAMLILLVSGICQADESGTITYDKENGLILFNSLTENFSIPFHETDSAGNSIYYFTHFAGMPAIAHDSNSLDSYTAYATLQYKEKKFYISCVYVDFKSNKNGLASKRGYCGLDTPLPENVELNESVIDRVTENIINNSDEISTLPFLSGKLKYLPIIIFQNKNQYVYELYKTRENLIDGEYELISCKVNDNRCSFYDNKTWVVMSNKNSDEIFFKVAEGVNNKKYLIKSGLKYDLLMSELSMPPFYITSDRSFFYDSGFRGMKSYLIKNDKITLLSVDENGEWCKIRFRNEKNKIISGNMRCASFLDVNKFKY